MEPSDTRKVDDYGFHTLDARRRYMQLVTEERLGRVYQLKVKPVFDLRVKGRYVACLSADFAYVDESGARIIEVMKRASNESSGYRIRKKLAEILFDATVREV